MMNCKMRNVVMVAAIAAFAAACSAGEIVVKGSGKVSCDPELMTISFEVSARDLDMATSRRLFGQKNVAAIAALQKIGVSTNEMRTGGLSVCRISEWDRENDKRVFKGYKTYVEYEIVLPVEIERCERIYAAVAESRAGEDFDVSFSLRPKTREKAEREARRRAVKNAKALAKELGGHLGVALGDVKSLTYGDIVCDDDDTGVSHCLMAQGFGGDDNVLVAVDLKKLEVEKAVKVVYEIKK